MFRGLLSSSVHKGWMYKADWLSALAMKKSNHQGIRKHIFWPTCLLPIGEPDQRAAWWTQEEGVCIHIKRLSLQLLKGVYLLWVVGRRRPWAQTCLPWAFLEAVSDPFLTLDFPLSQFLLAEPLEPTFSLNGLMPSAASDHSNNLLSSPFPMAVPNLLVSH